ncbi:hypothetical protein NSU18_19990 [Paenibacillus sp. FSL H8-0048]|uniref:hypothetical protein n=1 Tax=Paenibacillus sp. FSL H8-0048 TaxID=2954508 RepID=UPI0030F54784
MQAPELIAIVSIFITVIIGVTSWFISAHLTRRSIRTQKLTYEIQIFPIISREFLKNTTSELRITYKDELLPEPTLLAVDIINTGNCSIENPPITIEAVGATYVIPGYIEDIPPGYEYLWELERTDAEECTIHLAHINPGQVVKARFFLDEFPKEKPLFKCPMKDLVIREVTTELKEVTVNSRINPIDISLTFRLPWKK